MQNEGDTAKRGHLAGLEAERPRVAGGVAEPALYETAAEPSSGYGLDCRPRATRGSR